jgi:hypothetical protein
MRKMPSSLIMNSDVAWALSGLAAERAWALTNIVPRSSGAPEGFLSGPSCITTPVSPVVQIRIASSSGSSRCGALVLRWSSSPASTDTPRATRRVRRSLIACSSG